MSEPTAKTVVRELGGFSLLRELGEGGMGKVFLARQKSLDRKVALKVLLPELAKNEEFRTRFLREARAAALFSHSHIVSVVDAGVDEAFGVHYIAFEFVEGGSLEDLLQEEPRLEEDRALDISRGVLAGLAFAESKGIIHRDVKPDNVLVTPSGSPKLADLGLAKSPESMESQVTQTGVVLGTPLYMAPEQALGEDVLDIRADLYAWGLCLWRMLTGLVPFNEEGGCSSLQILTKHINEDLVDVRERNPAVSAEVAEFVRGLTARDRDERYPTAAAALADMDRLLAGERLAGPADGADAPPPPRPSSRVSRRSSRRHAPAAQAPQEPQSAQPAAGGVSPGLLAGILIGALGIGVGLALGTRGAEPPTPLAPEVALATPTPKSTPNSSSTATRVPASTLALDMSPDDTPEGEAPDEPPSSGSAASSQGERPSSDPEPQPSREAQRGSEPRPVPSAPGQAEPPAQPAGPALASVWDVVAKLDEEHPKLLDQAFMGKVPQVLDELRRYREEVVPEARAFLDTLVVAFANLQSYAGATDPETRQSAARELLALEPGEGPIGAKLRIVLSRLRRFVHLTTSLRTFALDLGPDRILNFQQQLFAHQSRAVLTQHAELVQVDRRALQNLGKSKALILKIRQDPGSEVGQIGQAWALLTLIERINTWRASLAQARGSSDFKGAPKELLDGGRGRDLIEVLRREPRLRLLVRAWGAIEAGRASPSLFQTALADIWVGALKVFARLAERSDDSLSAVLLELREAHAEGEFVKRRLRRVESKNELAPEGALGLVATGDLGQGNLELYFSKVSRKLELKLGFGKLGSIRVRVPEGGILRTALEPTPEALWVSHDGEGQAYGWNGKDWSSDMDYKLQVFPKGGKAFWTLAAADPVGSFKQEQALIRELAGLSGEESNSDLDRDRPRGRNRNRKNFEERRKALEERLRRRRGGKK